MERQWIYYIARRVDDNWLGTYYVMKQAGERSTSVHERHSCAKIVGRNLKTSSETAKTMRIWGAWWTPCDPKRNREFEAPSGRRVIQNGSMRLWRLVDAVPSRTDPRIWGTRWTLCDPERNHVFKGRRLEDRAIQNGTTCLRVGT